MREIKFRAWDKLKNEWMEPPIIDGNNGKAMGFSPLDGSFVRTFSDDEVELVEYTGLKDKNGREIYEGDIVKSATQNNVIEYQHGSFMVLGLHEDKYERTFSTLYHFLIDATIPNEDGSRFDGVTTNLEVIGNIYEHPHLLEGAAG